MLYSILIYDVESIAENLEPADHARRLERHVALQTDLRDAETLGPVARLDPTEGAVTLRPSPEGTPDPVDTLVTDGPFAETKEQLVGFYVVDCPSLEEAVAAAQRLPLESGCLEVRPIRWFDPGALSLDLDADPS